MIFKIAHSTNSVQNYDFSLNYARKKDKNVPKTEIFQKNGIIICVSQKKYVPLHPLKKKHRGVEQLVARQAHNLEVARSNPASATRERMQAERLAFFSWWQWQL